MTDESVRDKVRKLMALAVNEGAAPNEAETALRQAEKLMRKHGLELGDVMEQTGSVPVFKWAKEMVQMAWPKPVKRGPLWMHWTGVGVAKFTDTIVDIINTKEGQCLRFRGEETDVEYAVWLASHIRNEIRVSANVWDAPGANSDEKWANREEYRHSMASRINARMTALRAERQTVYESKSTALVVFDAKMVARDQEFGVQLYSKAKRSHIRGSAEAWHAGRAAGDKVQIHRPVGSTPDPKRLT